MNWELALAAWGAGLSTFLAVSSLFHYRRHRTTLLLSGRLATESDGNSSPPGPSYYSFTVTNTSSRPVTVVALGVIDSASHARIAITHNLSVVLTAGASYTESGPQALLAKRLQVEQHEIPESIRFLWAQDARGQECHTDQFPLRALY
jgi:hypothetical protein